MREMRMRMGPPVGFLEGSGIDSHWCMSAVGDGRRGRVMLGLGCVRSGVLGGVVV